MECSRKYRAGTDAIAMVVCGTEVAARQRFLGERNGPASRIISILRTMLSVDQKHSRGIYLLLLILRPVNVGDYRGADGMVTAGSTVFFSA